MSFWTLMVTALGVSADAFAVSVAQGLSPGGSRGRRTSLQIAATFGLFQSVMPMAGVVLGSQVAVATRGWGHWAAFFVLVTVGAFMLVAALRTQPEQVESSPRPACSRVLLLGAATSVDAFAVGAGLAFVNVQALAVFLLFGMVTFCTCLLGAELARRASAAFASAAAGAGGLLLVCVASWIVLARPETV